MQGLFSALTTAPLSLTSLLAWTLMAFVVAVAGGAAMGIKLAGKDLGMELAALMGGMFGPTAAVPGVVLGLIIIIALH